MLASLIIKYYSYIYTQLALAYEEEDSLHSSTQRCSEGLYLRAGRRPEEQEEEEDLAKPSRRYWVHAGGPWRRTELSRGYSTWYGGLTIQQFIRSEGSMLPYCATVCGRWMPYRVWKHDIY